MRRGRRCGCFDIHGDTGRKIWGTHVVEMGMGGGGGGGGV